MDSSYAVINQFLLPPSINYTGPKLDPNPFEAAYYPFVDIEIIRDALSESMRGCRTWIDENARGAAQVVIFGQRRNAVGGTDPLICRYFFTEDNDATLFKLFFG